MDPIINIVDISIRVLIFAILATTTGLLVRRMLLIRTIEMKLLVLFYILLLTYTIVISLRVVNITVPYSLGIGLFQVNALIMYIFLHFMFYKGRASPFKWILPIAISFSVLLVITGIIRDATPQGTDVYATVRWIHTILDSCQIWLGMLCQFTLAYKAYKQQIATAPEVVNRYLFMGLAVFASGASKFIDIVGTWMDINLTIDYEAVDLINSFLILFYALSMYLAWTMPRWFKQLLNNIKNPENAFESQDTSIDSVATWEAIDKAVLLTSRDIMSLVELLGEQLAKEIQKKPAAAKGFLLMAIQSYLKVKGKISFSIKDFRRFINTTLKRRLEKVTNSDVGRAIQSLETTLLRNQSLLFMMSL